jgi:CubicO group peptidase (beta-lactamase class C family)
MAMKVPAGAVVGRELSRPAREFGPSLTQAKRPGGDMSQSLFSNCISAERMKRRGLSRWHRLGSATALLMPLWLLSMEAKADAIDRYLARERALYEVPAIVVGVIRNGRLVDQRAVGLAQIELGVLARTDHVFEVGSISKQFTAYAILLLAERGRLDIHAPVGRYLPELPAGWSEPTLQQLMAHVSGLPDLENAFGYAVYREKPTDEDFLKRVLALPIEAAPQTKFAYSNTNYWLLARVIERVCGQSYDAFMQSEVFGPLRMKSTRSALPDKVLLRRAAGYKLAGKTLENRDAMQPHTGRGLGDIVTTLQDMARWEREQRAPRLVSTASAELARQPQVLVDGSKTNYGLGWFIESRNDRPVLRHDGQSAGFTAAYVRVPRSDMAVVVFANSWNAPTGAIADRIARWAEPALEGPALLPARDANPARQQRVREIMDAAVDAKTRWREEWFSPDLWRDMQPYLADIETTARRRGALRTVGAVGPQGRQNPDKPAFRVAFIKVTREMHFEFDPEGRVKMFRGEDL